MPCLRILTNLPKHRVPSDFVDKIIPTLSKAVNKEPEKFICVIQADCPLSMFGDSQLPGAVATLESIGNLGPKENVIISEKLAGFMETELGVSSKRSVYHEDRVMWLSVLVYLIYYTTYTILLAIAGLWCFEECALTEEEEYELYQQVMAN